MYKKFWELIAIDIERSFGKGNPSNWGTPKIRLFLLDLEDKLHTYYRGSTKTANENESSLEPISSSTFRRIFISKGSKNGQVRTRNIFANYLGYDSCEEYIRKNKSHFSSNELNLPEARPKSVIADSNIGFSSYINRKSQGFIGRKWISDEIEKFIAGIEKVNLKEGSKHIKKGGYFWIQGDPGIGKSAFAANLVKENNYISHFNIQNDGITSPDQMWNNLCIQLAGRYGIDIRHFPNNLDELIHLTKNLLEQIGNKESGSSRCIIIVDALDEADLYAHPPRANPLFLPKHLPENIYFIVTSRKTREIHLSFNCSLQQLHIVHDSSENLSDIKAYLDTMAKDVNIDKYLRKQGCAANEFTEIMTEKSEGNFMYLFYVIKDIKNNRYHDMELTQLPQGLEGYYEEHWRLIRGRQDDEAWIKVKVPVLATLALANKPMSLKSIQAYANIEKLSLVANALEDWKPFIHDRYEQYSIYHSSFNDFLRKKSQIASEAMDLRIQRDNLINNMKVFLDE